MMQHVDQPAPALRAAAQRRTLRLAWATLASFFLFFLLLVALAGLSIYRYYVSATDTRDARLIVRGATEWIAWQPANRSVFQGVTDQQRLGENDAVRIVSSAGYGQVASVVLFDQSQLDLWAGAELRLDELRTSRWNSMAQQVTIRQTGGYVRYDIKPDQPFESVRFLVRIGLASVELAPGGSYSIDLRRPERIVRLVSPRAADALEADVAVRSGSAVVVGANGDRVELAERQRVEVDPAGLPGLAVPARWELIRDGGFSQFSEEEYNNTTRQDDPTLIRANSWLVYSGPALPDEQRGYFRLSSICRPPQISGYCDPADRRTAAWFYRAGEQTRSFTTGITQPLGSGGAGIDIAEYRSLTFSLWARVLEQALEDAGDQGVECPVMIRFIAKRESPADPEIRKVACVYVDFDGNGPRVRSNDITYFAVPPAAWQQIRIDLRADGWLPDFRYLQGIEIFAQGHDYDSRVVDVSLVGEQ